MNSDERQTPDPLDVTRFGYGLGFVCDGDSAHETPQRDLAIKSGKDDIGNRTKTIVILV